MFAVTTGCCVSAVTRPSGSRSSSVTFSALPVPALRTVYVYGISWHSSTSVGPALVTSISGRVTSTAMHSEGL
jgi:hypothetical protein